MMTKNFRVACIVKGIASFIFFLFSFSLLAQTTYNIDDPEQLEAQTYVPGDEIILANGVYDTDDRIDFIGNGTADNPIVFRAENPGGVKFTGGLKMNIGGDYVVVDGFHWEGGYGASNFIQFRNGTDYANHSTIQNCVIDGLAIDPEDAAEDAAENAITKHRWIVLYGTFNRVLNCSFMNKASAGALVLAEYQYNAEVDRCATVGHIISNNYFYKYEKIDNTLSNSGDSETIRIGSSEYQNVHSDVMVSNNYFVESDGENEIITNKSKGNIFTNNTFRRCRGSLVLRHGSNAIVDGNFFLGEDVEGTGGIRITDGNHTITNNYIQDCINVGSQAKWNNGITFLGGGDNADVVCTSTNVTNGYQKSENINVSNNSIVNTNAPLFYNGDKGTTDPTGTVSDNLIYFAEGDPNLSDVISGDESSSYADLGRTLTYTGNVFTGTVIGETNDGIVLETEITATAEGEIFTFSGAGSTGKGADLGSNVPITDDQVGYGIGACFLNNLGENIADGNCTIETGTFLTVSGAASFAAAADTTELTINTNVDWIAVSNDEWITIDPESGSGNGTISVMVTENPDTSPRMGSITVSQNSGEGEIIRTVTVTQEGADLTDLYDLINTGTGQPEDEVTVHSFSKEEVNGTDKFNFASNTLDKDNGTVWAADDGDIVEGDFRGDGEFIIYDLGTIYYLDLVQFTTTNKSDPFGYQLWVSTSGTEDADFTMMLPTTGELLLTATNTTDFNQYEVNSVGARYVKLIGYGRYNSDGDSRTSVWSAIGEIEFYGSETVSTIDQNLPQEAFLYPIPARDLLYIQNKHGATSLNIFALDGRRIMSRQINGSDDVIELNVSSISNGFYSLILQGEQGVQSQVLIIARD